MLNPLLLTSFIIYIASLLIGFKIGKRKKKTLNKLYHKFKWPLYVLIYLIFIITTSIIYKAYELQPLMAFPLIANILFILYFSIFTFKETRCWKQHRMIPYNFFAILFVYVSGEILANTFYNYSLMLVFIYSILEFQFAKFSYNQKLIWD